MTTSTASVAPAGDVTLMFTDIEGSTRGWQTHGERFREALLRHNVLLRQAIVAHEGYEVKTIGDAFMVAFASPVHAGLCALEIQRLIEAEPFTELGGLRVRIGLHTDHIEPMDGDYFGNPVNRAARIESAAHGGMILLSEDTAQRMGDALPAEAILLDLGFHRLKDLSAPQKLFQLSHADLPAREYPALNTLSPDRHNFPAQLTSFVGRERESQELGALLADPARRLITITGPGGTGKTRLSLQVAADCVTQYRHGVWLIELAGVTRVEDVPAAIALALGIPLSSEGDARAQLLGYLRDRVCLLVLDNFEQIVEAARLISDLLKQCPKVTALISSRELLQVAGEHEYALDSLALPPPGVTLQTWMQYASLRLFVERCQSARAGFVLTKDNLPDAATICRHLEGLPLAVELTSSLARGMTPAQIVPRLRDRFRLLASTRRDLDPRQRSMRGAIDWSYDLLTQDERALFAELSVFVGGFSLEAAEAVCETPMAFDLVYTLRDKSLVRGVEVDGEIRYSMLETLREYAREKREQEPAQEGAGSDLNARHAAYYLEQAQKWSEQLEGSGDAAQAQARLKADSDNMRAGMDWAVTQDECDMTAAYGRALARFFIAVGLHIEGDQRLNIAEQACRRGENYVSLALLLLQRGRIAYRMLHLDDARRFYEESHAISKRLGDTPRLVPPLINLGNIAWAQSDFALTQSLWEEGLALARETDQPRYEAMLLTNLSNIASGQGDFEASARYCDQSLTIHRRAGDEYSAAYALMHMGDALLRQSRYAEALQRVTESKEVFTRLGRQPELASACIYIGRILTGQGRLDEAEISIANGLQIAHSIADVWSEMHGRSALGVLHGKRHDLPQAFAAFRHAYQIAQHGDRSQIGQLLQQAGEALYANGYTPLACDAMRAAHHEFSALKLWDAEQISLRLAEICAPSEPFIAGAAEGKADIDSIFAVF